MSRIYGICFLFLSSCVTEQIRQSPSFKAPGIVNPGAEEISRYQERLKKNLPLELSSVGQGVAVLTLGGDVKSRTGDSLQIQGRWRVLNDLLIVKYVEIWGEGRREVIRQEHHFRVGEKDGKLALARLVKRKNVLTPISSWVVGQCQAAPCRYDFQKAASP